MSFDKGKKYGIHNGKSYTLKKNSTMVYIPMNRYQVYQFTWDPSSNKYVRGDLVNIQPKKADYIIKDYYYPYEFEMGEDQRSEIKSKNYQMTEEIKKYQTQSENIWRKIMTRISYKQFSYQELEHSSTFLKSIEEDIEKHKYRIDYYGKKSLEPSSNELNEYDYSLFNMDNKKLSQQLNDNSRKFQQEIVVFGGQRTLDINRNHTSYENIKVKVGDIISYYVPISTSISLSTALHHYGKGIDSYKKFKELGTLKDVCCVYRYILPAGYPIYYVRTESMHDHEEEILLPSFIKGKINRFEVIDQTVYPIKFARNPIYTGKGYDQEKINQEIEEGEDENETIKTEITLITCRSILN